MVEHSMQPDANKLADLRVKHLELVQAVVARMASQGATLKNYCLTLTTAVAGFGITLQRPLVVLLSLLPITIFAVLDAQYLRLERHFRKQFDNVRGGDWSVRPDFEITTKGLEGGRIDALTSWSIISFYGPLAVAVVAVVFIARCIYGEFF